MFTFLDYISQWFEVFNTKGGDKDMGGESRHINVMQLYRLWVILKIISKTFLHFYIHIDFLLKIQIDIDLAVRM